MFNVKNVLANYTDLSLLVLKNAVCIGFLVERTLTYKNGEPLASIKITKTKFPILTKLDVTILMKTIYQTTHKNVQNATIVLTSVLTLRIEILNKFVILIFFFF